MAPRRAFVERNTKETQIRLELGLDGPASSGGERPQQSPQGNKHSPIQTPVPFLNHMLEAFAKHGVFELTTTAVGDVEIDDHHTVEDVGIVLGSAFAKALGDRAGIVRYGHATLPMDEVLVTAAIDFGGRPSFVWNVTGLEGKWIGKFDCELAKEFFAAFATNAQCNLHVLLHYGGNAHHTIECIFKAVARAADMASKLDHRIVGQIPSTKGSANSNEP